MTKKHFIALADFIKNQPKFNQRMNILSKEEIVDILAKFCESQNGNFKRERWIDYIDGKCGKNGGKVK